MKQALIKKGRVLPENVPAPRVSDGAILIKVMNSCVSAGTELTSVQGSGRSLIRRAVDQPENIKKLFNMARSEGISAAIAKVKGKLDTGEPTGYSLAGIVLAVGKGVSDIQPGDRVAAGGGGIAHHAEFVDVPRNLALPIPDGLGFPEASTVALGSIAMHGVRRAEVKIGEYVVVFGTGILGQLAVQLLRISGARVLAVDLDERRLNLAKESGAEAIFHPGDGNIVKAVLHYTGGQGADAVVFCAATANQDALADAFAMTRKKGRVVMVGVWGDKLNRDDIYAKEIDFLISSSYGPGRYDENYELRGVDYPYAYVRWTENRNMGEYLRLLSSGKIRVQSLIHSIYSIDRVEEAFKVLQTAARPLMVLLEYDKTLPPDYSLLVNETRRVENTQIRTPLQSSKIRVGLIGAGSFATSVHLPNLQRLKGKYEIRAISNRTGHKAQAAAKQFGAGYATTDYREILHDPEIDLVMICTRHNLHGNMVLECLRSGKHTFVEKPLCTTLEELNEIKTFYREKKSGENSPLLMVGFNRRFSKYATEIKKRVADRINPLFLHYRMNAGYVPPTHWVHTEEGGGRIVGEACHIIDLFSFLVDSPVKTFGSLCLTPRTQSISSSDNKSIILEYEDGSVATLEYFAVGSTLLSKELLEVHFDEKTILMDDYKSLRGYGLQLADIKTPSRDKGQLEELEQLAQCLQSKGNEWPISLASLLDTTQLTFEMR
jgi:predicted dehydrogenase/threonine dehydrogenase-like Zn-dependent dehydrogenase